MTVYRRRPPGTDDGRSRKRGVEKCQKKKKQILEAITKAIPNMSEFNKGYLLGMGEAMASNKKQEREEQKEGD